MLFFNNVSRGIMYYLSENEVIEKVKGSRIGLSCREANDRLIKNGKNQLEEVKKQSFLALPINLR